MTEPGRIVDAHVHHWDPRNTDWYPFLNTAGAHYAGLQAAVGAEDLGPIVRPFDQDTYRAETANCNVEKYVHVTVASNVCEETAQMGALSEVTGAPQAIIGGIDGHLAPAAAVAQLHTQARVPGFRGVRASEGLDHDSPTGCAVLDTLQDDGLVYELLTRPAEMAAAAQALKRYPSLTVVVEHTGSPNPADPDLVQTWREGMARLADLGDRVHCKLSALALPLRCIDADAFRPWITHSLEVFGPERCLFASNFPVDGLYGSFDDLYTVYAQLVAELAPAARDLLFAANAERLYRC